MKSNNEFWNSKDINWFTVDDFNEQGYEINYTKQFITNKALGKSNNRILPKDTVIICCTASIGTVAIANISLTTNQQFNGLVKKQYFMHYLLSKYIYYYCLTLKKAMLDKAGKTTFPFLSVKKLGEFIIPFPPANEQKRIVDKIESLLPLIAKYEKSYIKIETLNNSYKGELKKAILQYAIQGKLVKQNSNDEPADRLIERILDEKRQLMKDKKIKKENLSVIYKDPTDNQFYEKFDDGTIVNITDEIPFDIPNNWSILRLGNLIDIARGGSPRPIQSFLTEAKDGINWIKIGDTEKGSKYINKTKEKIKPEGMNKSRFVKKGDFILSNSMSFGRPYILNIDGCIHDRMAGFK